MTYLMKEIRGLGQYLCACSGLIQEWPRILDRSIARGPCRYMYVSSQTWDSPQKIGVPGFFTLCFKKAVGGPYTWKCYLCKTIEEECVTLLRMASFAGRRFIK